MNNLSIYEQWRFKWNFTCRIRSVHIKTWHWNPSWPSVIASRVVLGSFESLKSGRLLLLYRSDKILVKWVYFMHRSLQMHTQKVRLSCFVLQVSSNENAGVAGCLALTAQMIFCSFQICYLFFFTLIYFWYDFLSNAFVKMYLKHYPTIFRHFQKLMLKHRQGIPWRVTPRTWPATQSRESRYFTGLLLAASGNHLLEAWSDAPLSILCHGLSTRALTETAYQIREQVKVAPSP